MPEQKTRADSLRLYLTGATSDGGVQTDPNASLGGFRSATEETFFTHTITNPLPGIVIEHISGAHTEGDGTLEATEANAVAWTPPGGTQGVSVAIANGETKLVEGATPSQFLRVSRTENTALSGSATVSLSLKYNNVIAGDNIKSAEAVAGCSEVRALIVKNVSTAPIEALKYYIKPLSTALSSAGHLPASGAGSISINTGNFNSWPEAGFCRIETSAGALREIVYYSSRTDTTLTVPATGRALLGTTAAGGENGDTIIAVPGERIAKEAPTNGAIQAVADETTLPTDITWVDGITEETGVDIGTIAVGGFIGLWLLREIPVGAKSSSAVLYRIAWAMDSV